jgi:type II secretory pathway pseudopilin PulG
MRKPKGEVKGSILVWTVVVIAILSILAAEVLRVVSTKYQSALQTSIWQEALLAAESGIDLGIIEMRKSLYPAPNQAWAGWNNTPGNGVVSYGLTTIPNAGLAGTQMTIEVNVDAPSALIDPSNGWQYYRIRTIGTMPITGPGRATDNKQDTRLRRLSLRFERFTNGVLTAHAISSPRVSRRAEAIVRPLSSFAQAILGVATLNLNNQNIVIDSYDSRDAAKSTNGLYDEAKRQQNGDIATNGNLIEAGNAHIYGDVATNSGTVSGAGNVTGIERADFYQEPIPISAPTWTLINPACNSVTTSTTLTADANNGSSASRYQLSTISLSGHKTLTLAGNPDGSPTYIEIYVTGDISVAGTSQIVLQPGVNAKIYFAGNVDVTGNGIINTKNQPLDLQLFGIQPAAGVSKTVHLGGNGQISTAVYAPGHAVTINGGGTNGHVFGSVVGKSVAMTGVTNLHYDEALADGGFINSYKIVSWFEDNR